MTCTFVIGKNMKHIDQTDFEKWLRGRLQSLPDPEVSSEFLAAQRRSIYRRLDEPQRNWISMRWALSLAMLLTMVAWGLTLQHRHKAAPAISSPVSDDQLFSDLTAMEQSNEPKAIQPMHGLFQE
jgi:hypothetical protein